MSDSTTVYVCSYSEFDNLAHVPKGEISSVGITICQLNGTEMTRYSSVDNIPNPAYMTKNGDFLYVCSESILNNDRIYVYKINQKTTELELIQDVSSEGLSACYLHIANNKLFCINYWDSVISIFSLEETTGKLNLITKTSGNGIKLTRAMHLKDRHSECHTHSIEANRNGFLYVCDLGDDVMKVFKFDEEEEGSMKQVSEFKTGPESLAKNGFHGPRYTVFSKCGKFGYIVNEISNSVCVLQVSENGDLTRIQTVSSLPENEQTVKSTCGGINIHPSGQFVSVSNRGHDSIATFKISPTTGKLEGQVVTKTGGKTPRHFRFSDNGELMLVPNQDTDNVSIFRFDLESGEMQLKGLFEGVNSPNYVFM